MGRPAARLSELAFVFVAGGMLAFYTVTLWPANQPDLDVSPAWCRPAYSPTTGDRTGGLMPPSYGRTR
jgi:hypothetical protein